MAEHVSRAYQTRDIEVNDGDRCHTLPNSLHEIILEPRQAVPDLAERDVVAFPEERTGRVGESRVLGLNSARRCRQIVVQVVSSLIRII